MTAWVIFDEDGIPIYCAPSKQLCSDHINDAINEYDITEAGKWVIRFMSEKEQA